MRRVLLSYEPQDGAIGAALARSLRSRGIDCLDVGERTMDQAGWRQMARSVLPTAQVLLLVGAWGSIHESARQRYLIGCAAGSGIAVSWMLPVEEQGSLNLAESDLIAFHFVDFRQLLDFRGDGLAALRDAMHDRGESRRSLGATATLTTKAALVG